MKTLKLSLPKLEVWDFAHKFFDGSPYDKLLYPFNYYPNYSMLDPCHPLWRFTQEHLDNISIIKEFNGNTQIIIT